MTIADPAALQYLRPAEYAAGQEACMADATDADATMVPSLNNLELLQHSFHSLVIALYLLVLSLSSEVSQ
jgi:hypothetical protein